MVPQRKSQKDGARQPPQAMGKRNGVIIQHESAQSRSSSRGVLEVIEVGWRVRGGPVSRVILGGGQGMSTAIGSQGTRSLVRIQENIAGPQSKRVPLAHSD